MAIVLLREHGYQQKRGRRRAREQLRIRATMPPKVELECDLYRRENDGGRQRTHVGVIAEVVVMGSWRLLLGIVWTGLYVIPVMAQQGIGTCKDGPTSVAQAKPSSSSQKPVLPKLFRESLTCATLAEAVNHYVDLGEARAVQELKALPTLKLRHAEGTTRCGAWVCRILFEPRGKEPLRPPLFGAQFLPSQYSDPEKLLKQWPLYPVAASGKSFFVLDDRYFLAGLAESLEGYVDYCRSHGRFRTQRVPVPTRAQALHDLKLLKEWKRWKSIDRFTGADEWKKEIRGSLAFQAQSIGVPAEAEPKPDWKLYTYKRYGFAVLMPGDASQDSTLVMGGTKTVDFTSSVRLGDTDYAANSTDYPSAGKPMPSARLYDELRDHVVKQMNGRFARERNLALGKHTGREIYLEFDDDNVCRLRLFLVQQRLYQVSVVGTREAVTSKAADKFLGSFKLLK